MKFICLLSIAVILPMVGCGKSGPKTYPVEGTVTYQGKTLPTGIVEFIPEAKGVKVFAAKIESNGHYRTEVAEGHYAVRIRMNALLRGRGTVEQDEGRDADVPVVDWLIPEKYSDTATSELTADVKAEKNQTIDFPMK